MPDQITNPIGQAVLRALEEVEKARRAASNALAFINLRLSAGLPVLERQRFIEEKARAEREVIHLGLLEANLRAGIVVVDPLPPADVERLDALAAILDRAIRNDFIFNATLAVAKQMVDSAKEVGDIIAS